MTVIKTAYSSKGLIHFTVGAIIKKGDKILLIDRKNIPLGFAGIAGHVDLRETPEQALIREVKEESNLDILGYNLLFEETFNDNPCVYNAKNHHWYVFECETRKTEPMKNNEAKSIGWYSKEEIKDLELEDSWKRIFKKLGVI